VTSSKGENSLTQSFDDRLGYPAPPSALQACDPMYPAPKKLKILIDINLNLAAGLRSKPGE
jgi:hypothetical protein